MSNEEFIARILSIPGEDGFWKSDAEEAYLDAGQLLVTKGLSEEEAAELLLSLYWSAVECFGG